MSQNKRRSGPIKRESVALSPFFGLRFEPSMAYQHQKTQSAMALDRSWMAAVPVG